MEWLDQFPEKKRRGSWPRCVLFTDGEREDVAKRLTELVRLPHVRVSADDKWMPCGKPVKREDGSWDKTPSDEVQLDKKNCLLSCEIREPLGKWWLAIQATTPNWDIASTCRVNDRQGLVLVEAKAHEVELTHYPDNCDSGKSENIKQIRNAICEANRRLQAETENKWELSPEGHYQLSNRFAWSWKLATLKIPVVLVYLGFLNAFDMGPNTKLFRSESEWRRVLETYCEGKVDNSCWGRHLYFNGTPLIPVIRTCNLPFDPKN